MPPQALSRADQSGPVITPSAWPDRSRLALQPGRFTLMRIGKNHNLIVTGISWLECRSCSPACPELGLAGAGMGWLGRALLWRWVGSTIEPSRGFAAARCRLANCRKWQGCASSIFCCLPPHCHPPHGGRVPEGLEWLQNWDGPAGACVDPPRPTPKGSELNCNKY